MRKVTLAALPGSRVRGGRSMVRSVRRFGVMIPIVVLDRGDGPVLLDGRRRVAAARAAGLAEVPARTLRFVLTP